MLFVGAAQTWPSDSGSGFKNKRVSAFFQVREEFLRVSCSPSLRKMGLLVVSMVVTASSVVSLQAKNGLPPHNQVAAWSILGMLFMIVVSYDFTLIWLVISSLYPFISQAQHSSPRTKIMTFFLAFSVCFVVLSISIEGLFYSVFAYNLLLWIDVEAAVRKPLDANGSTTREVRSDDYRFQADDVRIALFFLFFVQVAFFGTGKYV